jgi:hypothetical protein
MKNGIRRRSFLKGLGETGAALLPGSALLVSNAQAQSGTFHQERISKQKEVKQ